MDPASVLGAAATAATVVQLCSESLSWLLRFQSRYKHVDLTVRLLITQLSTLRAALSQISEWASHPVHPVQAHVHSDLVASLDGCKFLIESLNERLERLEMAHDKQFSLRKKVQAVWGEKERSEFLTLLGHNIAALQLLLTAMQCQSQSDQTALLQDPRNHDIIIKIRDETSSLLFLRDDDSYLTRRSLCTENSEKLDSSFIFDHEIFRSRAYLTAMKSSMKRAVRKAHPKVQGGQSSDTYLNEAFRDNGYIRTITGDSERLKEMPVPLPVDDFFDFSAHESSDREPLSQDKGPIDAVRSSSPRGVPVIMEKEHGFSTKLKQESRGLLRMPSLISSRSSLSSQQSMKNGRRMEEETLLLVGNAKSSGSIIVKSMELAYGDLLETVAYTDDGVRETVISRKSAGRRYQYRVYDAVGLHSREHKWIYSFEEMSTLIYVVDLSAYDLPAVGKGSLSCVKEDLALFQRICSSKWLAMTPILLLMCSTDVLASKLQKSSLAAHFPDYNGDPTDVEAVKSFFRQRFLCVNQKYAMRIRILFTQNLVTRKLGEAVVASVEKILTEEKVLALGTR